MNDFFKTIQLTPDHRKTVIDELRSIQKEEETPLIMYGTAAFAIGIQNYLSNNGVEIRDHFADEKYLDINRNLFPRVKTFNEICKTYEKFNVMIGIPNHMLPNANLSRVKSNNIQSVFSIGRTYCDIKTFIDLEFFNENKEKFLESHQLFNDDLSLKTFARFIQAKISGNNNYLSDIVVNKQYFQEFLPMTKKEIFIDGGAYIGDTLSEFLKTVNHCYQKYYAFEPDHKNFYLLQKYITDNKIENIEALNQGLWHQKETLKFNAISSQDSSISDLGIAEVQVRTIDSSCNEKATFIKMDIEGAELQALKGAKNTIKKNRPKLAISVYHKPEDLFEIPLYIKSLIPDYRFFLRQHLYDTVDLVLYAI